MNEKEIGFRIREVRKSQNMTMKEFGEKLNLTNAMISMLESGKAELSAKNRQAILRTFNVNPNWLDYGKGDMFIKLDANKELAIEMAKILDTSTDYLLGLTDNPTPNDFYLTEKENVLINNYRSLSNDEKIQVEAYIQAMIDIKNSK